MCIVYSSWGARGILIVTFTINTVRAWEICYAHFHWSCLAYVNFSHSFLARANIGYGLLSFLIIGLSSRISLILCSGTILKNELVCDVWKCFRLHDFSCKFNPTTLQKWILLQLVNKIKIELFKSVSTEEGFRCTRSYSYPLSFLVILLLNSLFFSLLFPKRLKEIKVLSCICYLNKNYVKIKNKHAIRTVRITECQVYNSSLRLLDNECLIDFLQESHQDIIRTFFFFLKVVIFNKRINKDTLLFVI